MCDKNHKCAIRVPDECTCQIEANEVQSSHALLAYCIVHLFVSSKCKDKQSMQYPAYQEDLYRAQIIQTFSTNQSGNFINLLQILINLGKGS